MNKNTINFTLFMKSFLKTHSLRAIFIFSALTAAYSTSQAMNEPTDSSNNKKKQETSLFSTYQKESFNDIVTTTKKGIQKNSKNENENKKIILNTKQSDEMKNLVKNLKFSLNPKQISYQPKKGVKDEEVIQYVQQHPLLHRIDVSECVYLTDLSVIEIAKTCGGTLKEINLDKRLKEISFNKPNLQRLAWESLYTDIAIDAIINNCPGITTLNLSECRVSWPETIKNISKLSYLTHLNLSEISGISVKDEDVIKIVEKCPLTHLCLDRLDITDKTITSIANKGKLTHLSVAKCYRLTDTGIEQLGNCPNLTYLDVSDTPHVYEDALGIIAQKCPKLAYLKMRNCFKMTSSHFQKIAENCHSLVHLDVSDCGEAITNAAIIELAKNNPKLIYLNAYNDSELGDPAIINIAESCPNIEYINLGNCRITHLAIEALVDKCHKLKYVNLQSCKWVDQAHIKTLIEKCPELEYLDIGFCSIGNRVNDSIVNTVIEYGKKLKVFVTEGTEITEQGKKQLKDARPAIEFTDNPLIWKI
jgi:hypothetical protein